DPVEAAKFPGRALIIQIGGIDPLNLDVRLGGRAGVLQRVDNAGVAVAHGGILAHDADLDVPAAGAYSTHELIPGLAGLDFSLGMNPAFEIENLKYGVIQ